MEEVYQLTKYSHGGGCGCKIAPSVLDEILKTNFIAGKNELLLVGNSSKDDAAAYDLGNGTALISTTDFFMPIVNDAFDFGRIASANAISDVYAMGGKPILAIAILGWPVNTIPVHVAQKVLDGARAICCEAGIPLAGGHSIDTPEPIFGLAVSGICNIANIKRNNTAKEGDLLYLTKPIGVGIMTTAEKKGVLSNEHQKKLLAQLTLLNKFGEVLGNYDFVTALTDVTGFGLGGHLVEMAEGSGLTAELYFSKVQKIDGVGDYIAQNIAPGATMRNWSGYGNKFELQVSSELSEFITLVADPQTNGGLLFAVDEGAVGNIADLLIENGLERFTKPIGRLCKKGDKVVIVKN